jgi:hypothetical protein
MDIGNDDEVADIALINSAAPRRVRPPQLGPGKGKQTVNQGLNINYLRDRFAYPAFRVACSMIGWYWFRLRNPG